MLTERRNTRSSNPWTALNHLLEARASEGAVVADGDGLLIAAVGLPVERAERVAAEIAYYNEEPVVRTGSGVNVRVRAMALAEGALGALRNDVVRILAAV